MYFNMHISSFVAHTVLILVCGNNGALINDKNISQMIYHQNQIVTFDKPYSVNNNMKTDHSKDDQEKRWIETLKNNRPHNIRSNKTIKSTKLCAMDNINGYHKGQQYERNINKPLRKFLPKLHEYFQHVRPRKHEKCSEAGGRDPKSSNRRFNHLSHDKKGTKHVADKKKILHYLNTVDHDFNEHELQISAKSGHVPQLRENIAVAETTSKHIHKPTVQKVYDDPISFAKRTNTDSNYYRISLIKNSLKSFDNDSKIVSARKRSKRRARDYINAGYFQEGYGNKAIGNIYKRQNGGGGYGKNSGGIYDQGYGKGYEGYGGYGGMNFYDYLRQVENVYSGKGYRGGNKKNVGRKKGGYRGGNKKNGGGEKGGYRGGNKKNSGGKKGGYRGTYKYGGQSYGQYGTGRGYGGYSGQDYGGAYEGYGGYGGQSYGQDYEEYSTEKESGYEGLGYGYDYGTGKGQGNEMSYNAYGGQGYVDDYENYGNGKGKGKEMGYNGYGGQVYADDYENYGNGKGQGNEMSYNGYGGQGYGDDYENYGNGKDKGNDMSYNGYGGQGYGDDYEEYSSESGYEGQGYGDNYENYGNGKGQDKGMGYNGYEGQGYGDGYENYGNGKGQGKGMGYNGYEGQGYGDDYENYGNGKDKGNDMSYNGYGGQGYGYGGEDDNYGEYSTGKVSGHGGQDYGGAYERYGGYGGQSYGQDYEEYTSESGYEGQGYGDDYANYGNGKGQGKEMGYNEENHEGAGDGYEGRSGENYKEEKGEGDRESYDTYDGGIGIEHGDEQKYDGGHVGGTELVKEVGIGDVDKGSKSEIVGDIQNANYYNAGGLMTVNIMSITSSPVVVLMLTPCLIRNVY